MEVKIETIEEMVRLGWGSNLQLAKALGVSHSTIRRLTKAPLGFTAYADFICWQLKVEKKEFLSFLISNDEKRREAV